ncbi:MAG: GFA family protein [Methylobacteriaceae bacterium]|nr:GFA family protein [Methylobacteriaceae bacterium]
MNAEGGCLCGAVRYTFTGEPFRQFVCHCRDCQRSGGSAFHVGLAVPRGGFRITQGELQTYESASDSGRRIKRCFCPACGSGVINEPEVLPGYVVIRVGTLDDPSVVAPKQELYASKRARWLAIDTEA